METKGYPPSTGDDHALRAELERLQSELARERVMREVLERQLDEKLGVAPPRKPEPKPDRPSFLPWILTILVGMGLGGFAYHVLQIPLRVTHRSAVEARRTWEPEPVWPPVKATEPRPGS